MSFNQIAIAQFKRRTNKTFYWAKIKTGEAAGIECAARYRNLRKNMNGEVLVKIKESKFSGQELIADFISTQIPDRFEWCTLDSAILYGITAIRKIPNFEYVQTTFNPIPIPHFLYFSNSQRGIEAVYRLPKKVRDARTLDQKTTDLEESLRIYLQDTASGDQQRTIIIDSRVPCPHQTIIPELEKAGLYAIKMDSLI